MFICLSYMNVVGEGWAPVFVSVELITLPKPAACFQVRCLKPCYSTTYFDYLPNF